MLGDLSMRLLYYYGKIEKFDRTETDYVSINYSREYAFKHRTKDFFSCKNDVLELDISFAEKILPSNFWSINGKIYNCTVFIGENGSGKSTILQNTMASILRINREFYSGEALMVFGDKGTIHAVSRINDDIFYTSVDTLNKKGCTPLRLIKVGSPKTEDTSPVKDLYGFLNATKIAFISNAFSQNDLLDYVNRYFNVSDEDKNSLNSRLYNYSITNRITTISKSGGEGFTLSDQMKVYWSIRYKDEARFILSDRAKRMSLNYRDNCDFGFKIPNEITIKYASSLEDLLNTNIVNTTNNSINQLFDFVLGTTNGSKKSEKVSEPDYRAAFYISVYALLQSIVNIENSDAINDGITNIIKEYGGESKGSISVVDQKSILTEIKNLISMTLDNELRENTKKGRLLERIKNDYDKALLCLKKIDELVDYLYDKELMTKFSIVYSHVSNTLELQATTDSLRGNYDEFTGFIDKYTDTLKHLPRQYLSFGWGLSSGEDYILDFLASLNTMKTSIDEHVQTIQIYLDEADMGLHPEWQRKWLYVFPQMVEELFEDTGIDDIQFVLATHSPLLLGDIPSRCAKYVKYNDKDGNIIINEEMYDEEGKIETFGQNLYTILRNGFFLEKGAIGEIAIKKSEEIAEAFRLIQKLSGDIKRGWYKDKKDLDALNSNNQRASKIFLRDSIEIPKDSYVYIVNGAEGYITVNINAYLYYIEVLINQYSGFIKEHMMEEYIKTLLSIDKEENMLEMIDKEIARLEELKKKWK